MHVDTVLVIFTQLGVPISKLDFGYFGSYYQAKFMSIELRLERVVRDERGHWPLSLPTELVSEEEHPKALLKPARGKFSFMEEELRVKHGVEIPENWNVLNMLAVIAVGSALLTRSDDIELDPKTPLPEVSLIIDQYYFERKFGYVVVNYRVRMGSRNFRGGLHTPEYARKYDRSAQYVGMPQYTSVEEGKEGRRSSDFINDSGYTERGSKLIGFVASQISTRPQDRQVEDEG